jgi:hypothetical protein
MTDGQLASLSWNKAPIWGLRADLYYCPTVAGFLMWAALSDERTGLSFARVTVNSNKSAVSMYNLHFLMVLQPLWALASFQFSHLFKIGRTPWTNDQLVARPLPKHKTAQRQNQHTYTPSIHALRGIRTHDHSFPTSEDGSCLSPLGYHGQPIYNFTPY